MEIPEKLLRFKFHILLAFTFSFCVVFLCYLAPRFLDILNYFWPLLVSTALFLVAVVVFDRISPISAEYPAEKAGEGLLDYVAGEPPTGQVESLVEASEVMNCKIPGIIIIIIRVDNCFCLN
ncbi:hypothetical protein DH2020_033299 [Rehmannia glutinosa]|uniref:Uncharacterized protein n=1 Tax=Rehmannia glutinosa TaxID=99300 RepID=A0ABR0VEM0_REHGL